MLFLPWCHLTRASWVSFGPVAYSSLNDSIWSLDLYSRYFGLSWPITLLVGSFVPFLSSWASLTHFLILHFHGFLLNLLGFLSLITLSFILGAHGLSINPLFSCFIISGLLWPILTFLHHIMSISLQLLSLGSFRPIYLLYEPMIHCSYHSSLMVFLSIH